MKLFAVILIFISISFNALASNDINFEFGFVIFNERQEAIRFEKTNNIPIQVNGNGVMYGLLVTSVKDSTFTIDSVHSFPTENNNVTKVIGKTINAKYKAAIFLKTKEDDYKGEYKMEVFIDGKLSKTFDYTLVEEI